MQPDIDNSFSSMLLKAKEALTKTEELHNKGDFHGSTKCAEKGIVLFGELGDKESIFTLKQHIAANYIILGDIENASIFLNDFLTETLELYGKEHEFTAEVFNQLGYLYNVVLKDLEKGIVYSKKCLDIRLKLLGEKDPKIAFAYHNLGYCYGQLRDFDKQILYYQKALNIRQSIYGEMHDDVALSYNNIAYYYETAHNDNMKASQYLEKALFIRREVLGENHPFTGDSYRRLGGTYTNTLRFEEALAHLFKSLEIYKKIFGEQHQTTGLTYSLLGKCYLKMKAIDASIDYFYKAEEVYKLVFKNRHERKANIKMNLTEVLLGKEQYIPALQKVEEAFQELLKKGRQGDRKPWEAYKLDDLKINSNLFNYFQKRAEILRKCFDYVSQDSQYLKAALETHLLAMEWIDRQRKNYNTQGSQLIFNEQTSQIYEAGIEASLKLFEIGMVEDSTALAFSFSEKLKGHLLLSALKDTIAKTNSIIPNALLEKEKDLKLKLTFLDKKIQKLAAKKEKKPLGESDAALLEGFQNQFFDLHNLYVAFMGELESDYPDYYELKYDTKTSTASELQAVLKENQVVISYFVGEEKLYIFVITPDEFEVIDLQKNDDFEALIAGFMEGIIEHKFETFTKNGYQLHQLLIAPVRDFIVDNFGVEEELKQVFIIPHDILSYLPFEALIGEKFSGDLRFEENNAEAYQDLDYLINDCEISYHYSATLLYRHLLQKEELLEIPDSFGGFAPIYDREILSTASAAKDNSLPASSSTQVVQTIKAEETYSERIQRNGRWINLPHSEIEAKSIAELFNRKGLEAKTFLRKAASKEAFSKTAKQFKFLLVAAHGLVNDQKTALSGLVFYPENMKSVEGEIEENVSSERPRQILNHFHLESSRPDEILSMDETHHLDLQADLVVLSSCESGIGTLHKGEGMMAVNRGFLVAGANNVISTLFKVYDRPSSLLTQYLFENILEDSPVKAGVKDYSKALRLAKLKLMKQPNIEPKSWCGFVLIGG
ncbi:MAG: CHAT domain-containing protein [Chitinophagales bacterium]